MAAVRRSRKRAAVAEPEPQYLARRILLDTHTWLWWYTGDKRLGRIASALVKQTEEVWFSAASAWEIAIKRSIGKLVLRRELDIAREIERDGFAPLAINVAHAEEVRRLPDLHRDPFDRMLVAQARFEGLTIVTADEHLSRYGVATIDARR